MYVLFIFGINVVLNIVHLDILSMVIGLGLLVPNLAMGARRLHDTGRSGWLQLLWFIPIIGWIILIIWLAEDTKQADNEYGAPAKPKMVAATPSAPVNPAPTPVQTTTNETPTQQQ